MPDFSVHTRHQPGRHVRRLSEPSAEAAALAYVEDLPFAVEDAEVRVVVTELETGREGCFRIDLAHGEVTACA